MCIIGCVWKTPFHKSGHILTQHILNACQRKKGDTVLATKGPPERRSASFIKVSGRMLIISDAFKRRPDFSFTVTILA